MYTGIYGGQKIELTNPVLFSKTKFGRAIFSLIIFGIWEKLTKRVTTVLKAERCLEGTLDKIRA